MLSLVHVQSAFLRDGKLVDDDYYSIKTFI